jgi:CheY-like chemotaxis protein
MLNVDDDRGQRAALSRLLRQEGFIVHEAQAGEEALARAQEAPDLILLDVNLPDLDGFEVCRRLKEDAATRAIPILYLSGDFVRSEDRIRGLEAGADPGQIEQVIMNLAVNARDAMPQGGRLTIETCNVALDESYTLGQPEVQPGRYVLLAVSDTGVGIDAATQARVFEPFFTAKGERGTGLGLATVYGIVKQSGGHIAVYSEPGVGTTLKVYLPRMTGARSGKSLHGPADLPSGTETILLVEDDEGVRALGRLVLQRCGYTVLEADNGTAALRVALNHPGQIDLAVTDVVIPGIGGREFAARLADLRPALRVLYLSGYTDDAVVRHGVLESEVEFLQKPFAPAALAQKVRDILDRQAAGR